MLGGQSESLGGWVVRQVACAGHGAEPLSCIALLNSGALRQLRAGGWSLCMQVLEEPELVSECAEHDCRQCARVYKHLVYELLHLLLVDRLCSHAGLLT